MNEIISEVNERQLIDYETAKDVVWQTWYALAKLVNGEADESTLLKFMLDANVHSGNVREALEGREGRGEKCKVRGGARDDTIRSAKNYHLTKILVVSQSNETNEQAQHIDVCELVAEYSDSKNDL